MSARGATLRFDEITAAMVVLDPSGTLAATTEAASELLARAGVHGDGPSRVLPRDWIDSLDRTPTDQPTVWTVATEAGGVVRLGCTRYPLAGGRSLLLLRDIGPREQALSQLLHRQRLEATGRLVASIAHDLRAPLSSILLNASALAETEVAGDDDAARAIEDLCVAAERMQRGIERLLDFARIGPPVRETVPLRQTFGGVQQLVGPLAREGGHSLSTQVGPDAGEVVANRLVVEQILVNLVLNAIEASAGRPVGVHVTSERRAPAIVAVHVRDDGPGVPEHIAPLVFEPFFGTKPGSTGIGLSTARDAARDLGGDLTLEPSATGALFVLELPAPPSSQEAAR